LAEINCPVCGNKTDERGDCKSCGCHPSSLELEHILLSMELEEHGISLEPNRRPATRVAAESRLVRAAAQQRERKPERRATPIIQQKPALALPTLDFLTRNHVPGRPPSFLRM
jgi:hypothetical protein